jgi:hypothetical protein
MAKRKSRPAVAKETPVASPVSPAEPLTEPVRPKTHVAEDGDSYARIAARFPSPGLSKHERAVELRERNAGKPVNPGTIIKL